MATATAAIAVGMGLSAVTSGAELFTKLYEALKTQPHQLDVSDMRSPEAFDALLSEIASSKLCNFAANGKVWALLTAREALGSNLHVVTLSWVPGADAQCIVIDGVEFVVSRIKDMHEETLRLQTKDFARGPKVLKQLVDDAMISWENKHKGRVRVYVWVCGAWKMSSSLEKRPLDSLVLPDDILEARDEIRQFFKSKEFYTHLRVPWRRGYLFCGPPGTGKSSFVLSLASELERDIFVVELHDGMSNEMFRAAMRDVPPGAILLMEDIDTATVTHKREKQKEHPGSGLTLSTILNELDGITAKEGRLLIMTTNHPEVLDEALVRPGRVDKVITFAALKYDLLVKLIAKFFGALPEKEVCREIHSWFYSTVQPDNAFLSPAQVQGALLQLVMEGKKFSWPTLRSQLDKIVRAKRAEVMQSQSPVGVEIQRLDGELEKWFRSWDQTLHEVIPKFIPLLQGKFSNLTLRDVLEDTPTFQSFFQAIPETAKKTFKEQCNQLRARSSFPQVPKGKGEIGDP